MNSLILISPSKTWGFQPILSGKNNVLHLVCIFGAGRMPTPQEF
ncbi:MULTISPECIES: hypothetical protein [unclassified Microcoleus]|jgi:hypothetical protein|nr:MULTISPECIES: hypothetical protein [unclassified Microcoleus]